MLGVFQGLGLTYTRAGIELDRLTHTQRRILELLDITPPSDQQAHIGDEQAKLGEEQAKLGERQAKLGEQQAKLGEEQAKRAEQATRQLKTLIDEAFKKGLVEPEPR